MTDSAPSELTDAQADNALIGSILGGMIAFDQALTNRLTDSHIDTAISWVKRFRKLYDWVEYHNRDILVQNALDHFYWDREDVDRTIEHLESMKITGRQE